MWREQSAWFTCSVVRPEAGRVIVPNHKLMLVDCADRGEACFLSGALNAVPATLAIWAYVISIQQTTHIRENLDIPRYDAADPIHCRLAELS